EFELAMLEGGLAIDDVFAAWNDGMSRLLGVDVPDDAHGVLQDIHWGGGLIGYFLTYTLGNLMAVQLWEKLRADVFDIEDAFVVGNFSLLREWLCATVYASGRAYLPRELLQRATGQDLSIEPFMAYLTAKLDAAAAV